MTIAFSTADIAGRLNVQFPGSVVESTGGAIVVKGERLADIASFLRNTPDLDFDYLTDLTAVDYWVPFQPLQRK